eukprot:scaffold7253_cov385-Prasinococcus_capsulatus_cf.AAC.7
MSGAWPVYVDACGDARHPGRSPEDSAPAGQGTSPPVAAGLRRASPAPCGRPGPGAGGSSAPMGATRRAGGC